MVTTNSAARLDFRAIDYRFSEEPEEQALYGKACEAYKEVMRRLKPILKYVATEQVYNYDGVLTMIARVCPAENATVALARQGELTILDRDEKGSDGLCWSSQEGFWEMLPFCTLLTGLRDMLAKAEEKKREDISALAERRQFIETVLVSFLSEK